MDYVKILMKCTLFRGMTEAEITELAACGALYTKKFNKNEMIWNMGDEIKAIGVMISGGVRIETQDYWGNRTILARAEAGDMFGEAFYCAKVKSLPVFVCSDSASTVAFLDVNRVENRQFLQNLPLVLARKNIMLTGKIEHIARRTTREKVLSYLSSEAAKCGKHTFVIPFNRQELADYLAVDRSALSAELSKLRKEGVLDFKKNRFSLLE